MESAPGGRQGDGEQDAGRGRSCSVDREHQGLSERIHELHRLRESDQATLSPPTRRMMLDVPEEWFLLFAWLANRERQRRRGNDGETGLTGERIAINEHTLRRAVTAYMQTVLSDHFHAELHDLATGASPLLRPKPAESGST